MKTDILGKVKLFANKTKFWTKQHSPEILISAGVVGVVASAVMACVATTKVKKVVNDGKDEIADIHAKVESDSKEIVVDDKETKKALTSAYLRTGFKVAKLYAPSVILGSLSITSIITSNHILRERNMAIAAAYAVVDKGFKNYRANVVERYGEDVDKELRYGIKTEKITEKSINPETGKEEKVKKEIKLTTLDPNEYSDYARFYDCGNKGWTKDPEYNLMFLKAQQSYANDKLKAQGYLFLNDVYDLLGIPRSKAGQVVGWIYDENNPVGDNYVDFNIYNAQREGARDFVNGCERTILLDFNVDGPILDRAKLYQ